MHTGSGRGTIPHDLQTPDASLPTLTLTLVEIDATIAVASGDPGSTMLQIAAKLKLAPCDLAEILEYVHVAAFAQAADELAQMRDDTFARQDHHAVVRSNLVEVARDRDAATEACLRAVIALLRRARDVPSSGVSPAPASTANPITLHHTAVAPIARRDHCADRERNIEHRAPLAAPRAAADRPP